MINISQKMNNFNVSIGGPEKASVTADLHVGGKVSMGATMRFTGAWLDKQRASLKPGSSQQILFDVAVKMLKDEVPTGDVRKTDTGREVDLYPPVLDAKTLTIGFEKSMPDVLTFLGMKDGKGKTLLSLGAKLADAISPPPQQGKPHSGATRTESSTSRTSLAAVAALRGFFTKSPVGGQQPGSKNHSADISQPTSGIIPPSTPGRGANAPDGIDLNAQAPQKQTRPPVRESATSGQRERQEHAANALRRSQSAPPPRPPKEPLSAEQPNWQASLSGERMRENSLPEINVGDVGDFEREANAALAAIGNPAPAPVTKPSTSPQRFEAKLDSESQPDSGESRR